MNPPYQGGAYTDRPRHYFFEPDIGIEPITYALQVHHSTN